MANNEVKFRVNIDVDGQKKIVDVSTDISHLADEFEKARTKSTKLRDKLLEFTQTAQSFQNLTNGLRELTGILGEYTSAASAQEELETKLSVNMRNTMDARDEDISSIKSLISAQQQLGVVSDEVQLSGAQELATYLSEKETLERLIPVMNDMVAQQYGINATQESATNIATMLGKVMDGQVGALSRYGYKFDEAQEQILKFGTESQRAAVLAEVVESAVGGMNEELGKTDAGGAKHMADFFEDIKKQIGSVFAALEPTIIGIGEVGMALNALSNTYNGIKGVTVAIRTFSSTVKMSTITTYAQATASRVASAAQFLWSKQLYYGRQASIAWAFGAKVATVQAIAMRGAIMGLMAVTGVGLAIMAVSSILSLFARNTDDATASMKAADEEARRLKESEQGTSEAYSSVNATLEINQAKLQSLMEMKKRGADTSSEEKKIVGELNSTYGETMGYFSSVSQWYEALTQNSKAYCEQMVLEAKTRQLANQIAEMELEKHNFLYDDNGKKRRYSTKRKQKAVYVSGGDYTYDQKTGDMSPKEIKYEEIVGSSDFEKATAKIAGYNNKINNLRSQLKESADAASKIKMPVVGSPTAPSSVSRPVRNNDTSSTGDKELTLIENARSYKDLANNVSYYQQELDKADITDAEHLLTLARAKKAAEEAVTAFKDLIDAANVPTELKTLDDYDKKLQYLRRQRQTASKEHIAQIDAQIEKTEAARQVLEDESVATLKDDEIKTYDDLNKKLSYYQRQLEVGDSKQREFAQKGINSLNKLRDAWDFSLEGLKLPATTDNVKDLDAAISFYTERQQREDADAIEKTQRLIDELTAKKKTLQIGIELPQMQREIEEIDGLSRRDFKLKVVGIGFDELSDKIKELNELLEDASHPVTSSQREEIEGMIRTYESWRRECVMSFNTVKDGWDSLKGIGSSIEGITSALEGNGNAWQRVTSLVDGFISLYESIEAVAGIIRMLTAVSDAHSGAKIVESSSIGATVAASAAEEAASAGVVAATAPVIAANKAATASYMELASAAYFAAHASIPFAGFGIASGFIASAVAIVEGIGVTPFADGGVVSGPTLALVGEYVGASNNPEVIAPLDKLRSMLKEDSGVMSGDVEFRIRYDDLVGILRKGHRKSLRG